VPLIQFNIWAFTYHYIDVFLSSHVRSVFLLNIYCCLSSGTSENPPLVLQIIIQAEMDRLTKAQPFRHARQLVLPKQCIAGVTAL
jgi:hypothetical protein